MKTHQISSKNTICLGRKNPEPKAESPEEDLKIGYYDHFTSADGELRLEDLAAACGYLLLSNNLSREKVLL